METLMKYFALLAALGAGLAQAATGSVLPAGAEALGYTETLFDNSPTLASVSVSGNDSTSEWYAGEPGHTLVQNLAQREMLSTVDGHLAIPLGSAVLSVTRRYTQAALPLLDGSKGFYVEFAMHLSSNDPDHFYGLYLLPAEHNIAKSDHFSGDPAGFERWTEIDVSESGFGPGSLNTVINWTGNYPQYSKQYTNSYGHDKELDFTKEHRYGVSYDPTHNVLQWYLDDVPTFKASTLSLSKQFHYEIVMDADSHGANKPYTMYVHNVRAYSNSGGVPTTTTNSTAQPATTPNLTLDSATPTVPSGSSTNIPLSASHFDDNSFHLQVVKAPGKGSVNFNGNVAIYKSSAGSSGTDSFTVQASDQVKSSTPLVITVKIQPVASAPAAPPSTTGTTATGGGTTSTTTGGGAATTTTAASGVGASTTTTTTATEAMDANATSATTEASTGGGGSMDTWALAVLLMGVGVKGLRSRSGLPSRRSR
jgi:hypothetical protein